MRGKFFDLRWSGALVLTIALSGCGGDDGGDSGSTPVAVTPPAAPTFAVTKATACSTGSVPETGLQGQVPAALRTNFQGFNCNLKLVGQLEGEGGNWSSAMFSDSAGHTCAYHATATPQAGRVHPGVPVIDITNRAAPVRTASLTTPAMTDPWESLRVNERRQVLIADNGQNGAGGPEVDIYDLSGDCRSPQLLASAPVGTGADGAPPLSPTTTPIGHEGGMSPDGLTYYVGSTSRAMYYAVDVSNTTKPKELASISVKDVVPAGIAHGLSISNDGNRVYVVSLGFPAAGDVANPNATLSNGLLILDTSEVQARKPGATIKLVSKTLFKDGSVAQHTIPAKIAGKPYLVFVDEGGSGGLAQTASVQAACDAGLPPFPFARIMDVSDETKPVTVSRMLLETHDPKNCATVLPDIAGLTVFTYGSHYCTVDNRDNATALACAYQNSGIRVFDIRDPAHPKEVAYYNPKSASSKPGSNHVSTGNWRAGGPDWCSSRIDFDYKNKELVTMCQDNGLLVLKLDGANTWPFAESTPATVSSN